MTLTRRNKVLNFAAADPNISNEISKHKHVSNNNRLGDGVKEALAVTGRQGAPKRKQTIPSPAHPATRHQARQAKLEVGNLGRCSVFEASHEGHEALERVKIRGPLRKLSIRYVQM